jgi:hypothetical protein
VLSSPSESGGTFHKFEIAKNFAKIRDSQAARRCLSIAFLTLCSTALLWVSFDANRNTLGLLTAAQAAQDQIWPLASAFQYSGNGHRMVFPYSIIPGGADSAQELRHAVAMDPVVAEHYSDFDLAAVRRITLGARQLMYVSYRIGNNVFWTKRRLTLPKGETILTDGHAMARTRCGNRVSALPIRPNALAEPTAEEFDAPVLPPMESTPYLAAYATPPPAFASGSAIQPGGSGGAPGTPIVGFFPLPGGGGGGTSSTPPPGGGGGGTPPPGGGGGTPPPGGGGGAPSPPGPPVGIPEPGTGVLVLVGLSAAWLMHRSKKAGNL